MHRLKTLFGLDYSPAATSACGGGPRKVRFKGAYPDGSPVCLDADTALGPGLPYANVTEACVAWCNYYKWIDDNGNTYGCENIVRPSVGFFDAPVNGACTSSGILRPDFRDLRRITPAPVEWDNLVNAVLIGVGNGLRKTSVAEAWGAGAASTGRLNGGDGFVEFTATETTRRRMAGLLQVKNIVGNLTIFNNEDYQNPVQIGTVAIMKGLIEIQGGPTDENGLTHFVLTRLSLVFPDIASPRGLWGRHRCHS